MWKHGLVGAVLVGSAWAQVTQRVSVDSSGGQAYGGSSYPSISADGRYVAFTSGAANLVIGDTNGCGDIFVHDRLTGTTERVSVAAGGTQGNGNSTSPSISANGRFVAFESSATNLVPGDSNGSTDIFVRDRQAGTTERVSVSSSGVQANGSSGAVSISSDGRFVAFGSDATNLVAGDTNNMSDVFVRDRQLGTTERVSLGVGGTQGNDGSYDPSISADGRYVAFDSNATNLVNGDTNGYMDFFVRDRQSGTTERVSIASNGAQANSGGGSPEISADGRFVAFDSDATNLVFGDTNGLSDVFVRDRQLGTTERVSIDSTGTQGNGSSEGNQISANGRYVAYFSYAANLVNGDTNGWVDVYVRDRWSGSTERVSISSSGEEGNNESLVPAISSDGRFVAFYSSATNLVDGDTNRSVDVFVHDREAAAFTNLCDPGADGVMACPCSNAPGGSGRGCDNSGATGGAALAASGVSYISADALVFLTSGEKPTATSVLLQGTSSPASGVVYGQGVRCAGGTLKRLFTKMASGGSITAPNFGAGDPTVSARSAAKGSPISAGDSRYYLVYYRDPVVLGGCPASSTFNCTQTGMVTWSP